MRDWCNAALVGLPPDTDAHTAGLLHGYAGNSSRIMGEFPIAEQLKFYDAWGSADSYPHMAVAWSWAFDTPFRWTKQVGSHFGGTRQGMAISWPARIKDAGGVRNQFHHVIDIVPTILEATGVKAPTVVDGIQQ